VDSFKYLCGFITTDEKNKKKIQRKTGMAKTKLQKKTPFTENYQ